MKPICFRYEQYLISKALLHQYIRSPLIVNRLGENFVLRVTFLALPKFVRPFSTSAPYYHLVTFSKLHTAFSHPLSPS